MVGSFHILPAINILGPTLLKKFSHHSGRWKVGKPAIQINTFSHSRRGKGHNGMADFLCHATTPAPLLTHNATINLFFLNFAIQRGMWQTGNIQQSTCCFYFLPFRKGEGENDMVDCFYFFTSATTPAPPINPQCNNQPVVFIFSGRGKGASLNLLFLFFPFWKWENAMLTVCQKSQDIGKQNLMLSFLI